MKSKVLVFAILALAVMSLSGQAAAQSEEPAKAEEPAATQQPVAAQEPAALQVAEAAICKDVVDHVPMEPGTSFSAPVGKLYCFTKITGAQVPAHVTHVWYFDGVERARVELGVNSPSWRTYSSKIIQPHEMGAWRVEVLDPAGNVLQTLDFEVRA